MSAWICVTHDLPLNVDYECAECDAEVENGIACPRCGILLGDDCGKCKRAVGSDICFECAMMQETSGELYEAELGGDASNYGAW